MLSSVGFVCVAQEIVQVNKWSRSTNFSDPLLSTLIPWSENPKDLSDRLQTKLVLFPYEAKRIELSE